MILEILDFIFLVMNAESHQKSVEAVWVEKLVHIHRIQMKKICHATTVAVADRPQESEIE